MNDLPGLPPVSVDKGVSAPVPEPGESLQSEAEGQQAFDDALQDGGNPHSSQAPQTRRAIKKSLDRLPDRQGAQGPPGQGAAKIPQDRLGAGGPTGSADSAPPGSSGAAADPSPSHGSAPAAAPNGPLGRDAPPSMPATAAGPARVDASRTAFARRAQARGSDEATPPRPPKDAPGIGGPEGHPGAQAPPRTPGPPRTAGELRQAGSGQEIDTSQSGRAESGRAADGPRSRGPDVADRPEAQPADLTGVAAPAGAPEAVRIDAPDSAQTPAPRAAELAEKVADRILVSAPEPGSSGEVRISLKESVLDGSDVRIFRDEGELRIVFVPKTEAAGRFLADNGRLFQQALGERLQDERVRVEVEPASRDAAGQQDDEGRSRQQYVSPDDPAELN